MKLNKFLAVGCAAALVSMAPSVFAASKSDAYEPTNNACTIAVNDTSATRFINVNHIRLIQLKNSTHKSNDDDNDGKTIHVALTHGPGDSYYDYHVKLGYRTKEDALKALENLRDKINDCQHDAAIRRANRNN